MSNFTRPEYGIPHEHFILATWSARAKHIFSKLPAYAKYNRGYSLMRSINRKRPTCYTDVRLGNTVVCHYLLNIAHNIDVMRANKFIQR